MLCFFGITIASGQSNVVEDFGSYTVPNQTWLDPTTVPDSGWTRSGVGDADWEVRCCSGTLIYTPGAMQEDDAIDTNSVKFLVLRRSNANVPARSDENTEYTFPVLVEGTLRFQLNPASTSSDPFKLALRDSGSGKNVIQMVYTEDRWPEINSGDFRVQDGVGNLLISDVQLDGEPDSFDRGYDIIFTMHQDGTFDLEIVDIGPTAPSSMTSNQVARGTLASVSNITAGVLGIDTFRLESGTGNGGGAQPTMIDNLTITRIEGLTVAGTQTGTGLEMPYTTVSPSIYQPQVTEDLTTGIWTAQGPPVLGDGALASRGGGRNQRRWDYALAPGRAPREAKAVSPLSAKGGPSGSATALQIGCLRRALHERMRPYVHVCFCPARVMGEEQGKPVGGLPWHAV